VTEGNNQRFYCAQQQFPEPALADFGFCIE
jgi:hypothetical protein